MPRWSGRGAAVTILCLSQLAAACTASGPRSSATRSDPTASAGPTKVVSETQAAGRTQGPSGSPASLEPPVATLVAEGGDPATGQLGSFTWDGGGSDSPWLPGTPLAVGRGERLTVALADDVGVSDWEARRVPAGVADGIGAVRLGGGRAPVTFAAPGPGAWSVQVTVRFAGGLGSAAYYWRLGVR